MLRRKKREGWKDGKKRGGKDEKMEGKKVEGTREEEERSGGKSFLRLRKEAEGVG